MAAHRRQRRSEGFAVRRWLQLGAASAGVGAGLLGFSLLGPQIGSAAADTTGESGATMSAPASDGDDGGSAAASASKDAASDGDDDDRTAEDPDDSDSESDAADDLNDDADDDEGADDLAVEDDIEAEDGDESEAVDAARVARHDLDPDDPEPPVEQPPVDPPPVESPAVVPPSVPAASGPAPRSWSAVTGRAIDNWTSDSQGWINSLPVASPAKYHLSGAMWATRRTLFNQAPDVAPLQITGKLDGPVTGTVGAADPDGDRLVYVVTRGPKHGSVRVNSDGTYTYTPGDGFEGVDTFRVVAIDVGPHVNLLDPFRPIGTGATHLLNQRAIKFEFTFTDGAEHWTPERVRALRTAADDLVVYFVVEKPVVLTYEVTGMDDDQSGMLAGAGSDLIKGDPGFWPTVVQHKLLTGEDANGSDADGGIVWNFAYGWALGATVEPDEYDFNKVAVHEFMHSLGFTSRLRGPGEHDNRAWPVYAGFLVTRDHERPFRQDHSWNTDFDGYLTGLDGGLFFGGAHAVAAYGGLVPLYTPAEWAQGSSVSHLDDETFTGDDQKVMNAMTGTGFFAGTLSPIELGILRDLGYRIEAPGIRV